VCDRRGCDGLLTSDGVGQWRQVVPASVSIAGVRLWFESTRIRRTLPTLLTFGCYRASGSVSTARFISGTACRYGHDRVSTVSTSCALYLHVVTNVFQYTEHSWLFPL